MKYRIIYICLAMAFLMPGCIEDKGNYDYSEVDVITISGISDFYALSIGDNFTVPVTLSHSLGTENSLRYLWEIDGKTVSTNKDIDITITSDFPYGPFLCRYTVTDEVTGMEFSNTFWVVISSAYNWGYYLLTEKEDHSTVLSYLPIISELRPNPQFMHDTSIGSFKLGDYPVEISGKFTGIQIPPSTSTINTWVMAFSTQKGIIVTNNNTFIPRFEVTSNSYMGSGSQPGEFKPEFTSWNMEGQQFVISNGKFIRMFDGLIYQAPTYKDDDGKEIDYYWQYPLYTRIYSFGQWIVFDRNTEKWHAIMDRNDANIFDLVEEIKCPKTGGKLDEQPSFAGHRILGYINEPIASCDVVTAISADATGLHKTVLGIRHSDWSMWSSNDSATYRYTFPLTGVTENSKAVINKTRGVNSNNWYVNLGNKIYTAPNNEKGNFELFAEIPQEYGDIVDLGLSSATGKYLVVATYDSASPAEYKGSFLFVDTNTMKITTVHKNVIHKCVSLFAANSTYKGRPYSSSYGDGL